MLNKKISFDERVAKLSLESKLLFTWTIPHLDVKGRFFANPEIIKGQVCPFVQELSLKKIEKCLTEIAELGLITIYGKDHKYLEYCGFSKNQTITESRESQSEIPDPTQAELKQDSSGTQQEVKISKDKLKINLSKEDGDFFEQLYNQYFLEFVNLLPVDVWKKWVDYRKEIKHKLTKSTVEEQLKELLKLNETGNKPVEVINQSIRNGWQGLFEIKNGNSKGTTKPESSTGADANRERFSPDNLAKSKYHKS